MPPDKEGAMALQPSVTLLIIDDEPGFARGLARLLHRDGYTVDTADNGQRALATFRHIAMISSCATFACRNSTGERSTSSCSVSIPTSARA
jgi:ActR/RegA family two-component response regulator